MLVKKFFRTAKAYKAQFISMVIMIAIGVGVFLGFNIEWHSIESETSWFFSQTNYADFRLYSESGFSKDEIDSIKEIEGVTAASRYLFVNASVKNTEKTVTVNVSEDYLVSTAFITDGADYDENSDGVWLSDRFAKANGFSLGDEIIFVYQNVEISGKVVGLCKSGENMICVADSTQLMPDYETHGFAYVTPKKLKSALGFEFYPQINVVSDADKADLELQVKTALGKTVQVVDKSLHTSYAGAQSEAEEGKTMGAILPVLFLAIAILTMVTTMHRIAANEKVQTGTLKALGFRDKKILAHYTLYGVLIGVTGVLLGVALGYGIAAFIMNPHGMMATYFDLPRWNLTMPYFCIPVILFTVLFLTLISYLSVKKMLKGTAAEALRPYTPKTIKKSAAEKLPFAKKLPFSVKWNLRDVLRHKARSLMTLIGVCGCMVLLVGGLGMNDTMQWYLGTLGNDVCNYATKVNVSETADDAQVRALVEELNGDWQSSTGVSYNGDTVTLDIYAVNNGKVGFLTQNNKRFQLGDDGVYLCLRLKDTAKIGDYIQVSPYGSEDTYCVKVAGYFRSLLSESIAMTETYANKIGVDYHINAIYTDFTSAEAFASPVITGTQNKASIMDTYDTFMQLLTLMVVILIVAAIVLGVVVLYNLGVMSYVERRRELATLKVLGFRDKAIGGLLISQNVWLTLLGVIIGLPLGAGVLYYLITALASEYEMCVTISLFTCVVSVALTFGVSFFVGLMVAAKNKKINMVEALKCAE